MHTLKLVPERDGDCDCEFITIQSPTHILTLTILDGSCVNRKMRLEDTKEVIRMLQAQVHAWEAETN